MHILRNYFIPIGFFIVSGVFLSFYITFLPVNISNSKQSFYRNLSPNSYFQRILV